MNPINPGNPWQTYLMLCGLSALVGGGCGAGAALMYTERRVSRVESQTDSLERRVTQLEQLPPRVAQLESGAQPPARG